MTFSFYLFCLSFSYIITTVSSRKPTKSFKVTVTTGKAEKSGTNATVRIALIDESGTITENFSLNRLFYNDFEYGREDTYDVTTDAEFGKNVDTVSPIVQKYCALYLKESSDLKYREVYLPGEVDSII